MKIVVALDKFKGSLTATEACDIVSRALRTSMPGARIVSKPMADGGEGTATVLKAALGGTWISKRVMGPLPGMRIRARYLWLRSEKLAVVEMAEASGLALLTSKQRNPLRTTSLGTGELLADAVRRGAKRIWLTVGGSATVDGGVGAAKALGWRFLDARGKPIGLGGGELERLASMQGPKWFPKVEVLCDVDNPLCGEHGAARVFGPQKGATPAMVRRLEAGMRNLAGVAKVQLGKDLIALKGGGAAGGMGAGAVAFMDARLVSGVEMVMKATGLDEELDDANWVITGEGQFDEQSLRGKVVAGVASLARKSGAKVAVLAGRVGLGQAALRRAGVDIASAITPRSMGTTTAVRQARKLLYEASAKLACNLRIIR